MLESYKIAKSNNEDVLYLYLNVNYEFANELTNEELNEKAINYLTSHNIKFNGNKVVFIVNGISTKLITLNRNKTYLNNYLITLNKEEKITIKELLLSLLFSNINLTLKEETLKALTILYRSEIINNIKNNDNLDLNKTSLIYHNYNYYKVTYPETYKLKFKIYNKIIDETDGEYLIHNNEPIKCYTHLVSNGYTEEDKNIPYTVKKESLWDLTYPNYMQIKNYSIEEFRERLNLKDNNYDIKITSVSNSNRITGITLGSKEINPKLLAIYLDLPSTDITIIIKKDYLTFVTRGIGSGLGLSIIGADNLAELGYNYKQILNYYFKDVSLIVKK